MSDQEIEHTIASAMNDITVTVHEVLDEKRRIFPAMIILYSSLDIVGSLMRPKANPDTSGADFKNWVDRYLLKGSSLPATADDLWGARCGLLHTGTAGSRSSRTGKSREIHYLRGDKEFAKFAQQEFKNAGENKVVVDIDELFDAFLKGLAKFTRDIQTDAAVKDTVFYHAQGIFQHSSYKTPQAQ